jgi:signal transduction histidine kinase
VSHKPKAGTVTFRPRARLLKLIGEELISDDVVAVAELVKNAHDADALTVTVSFRGVTTPDGEIEVRDDGTGMDLGTLLGRWMQPAASTKGRAGRDTTARGRRVLGEKGVGRFAADKLASRLELVSRCPGSTKEVRALVDWDAFADGERMLEDVQARWEVRRAAAILDHGTSLRMTGLRAPWTERMFRRLSIRLGRLLSPFQDRDRFSIRIESDEFPEYSGELRSDILDRAPYRIEASFDGAQTVTVTTPRLRSVPQRWNGQGELRCGPVRVRLYAYDLEAEALARIGPRVEVRAWLREWTGVSIYRDGFRVWPYGEPHDDWLRLDQRRVNNPVEHLSNNQVIGFIDISRDGNPDLLDQTNREGLVQNQAVEDLRRLVYFVVQILETERQSIRHPSRSSSPMAPGSRSGGVPSVAAEIERVAGRAAPSLARELRQLGSRLEEEQSRERATQERQIQGYEGLAALGQIATLLLPTLSQELAQVRGQVQTARRALSAVNGHGAAIEQLAATVEAMAGRLESFPWTASGADRRRAIDIIAELDTFRKALDPVLRSRDIRLEIECPEREVMRTEMRPEHFHCVLHILAGNSLDWIDRVDDRRIRVVVGANEERCEIVFSDTGPGIPVQMTWQVFEPGFSMKEGGRGMGLTLAQRIVEGHGGSIHVILDGRRKGANFRVVLPRKRSRATFNGR